jgi:spoIIIJ-associated protein
MRFVIKEGKNLEEAVNEACKELNVDKDRLNVEVLSNGSKGFFGLVSSKKTIIRATVKSDNNIKLIEDAKDILKKMLEFMNIDAKIEGKRKEEVVYLTINSKESNLIIGRNGETLSAIQFILNRIINKNVEKGIHIEIDSENYKERKRKRLKDLAIKMAEKVKRSAKPISTEPMNPEDRRIIYMALENYKDLRTSSKGEGILKKVIIFPKS